MSPKYNIPLIRPYLPPGTKERVAAVLDSGYLTEGPVTREFEERVAEFLGIPHVLAVTSCTTGLEMALRCLGIGPGDEVIVPAYTYPATAAVVALVGATIVLVDVDPETMLIDYAAAAAAVTDRTKAVLPVSQFGNPLDYGRLTEIGERHGLLILEDAACALGAEFNGARAGTQADIAVFSCHPRKFITTGEGGLVVTANDEWAAWMNSFKHFGMASGAARVGTTFERIGTNYKLSNVLAAIGLTQMGRVTEMLARRRELAGRYLERLAGEPRVALPVTTPGGVHSWQTFALHVDARDRLLGELRALGIEVQIGTYALHRHTAFAPGPRCRWAGDLAGTDRAFERALALPLYHTMRQEDQDSVVDELVLALDRAGSTSAEGPN